MFLKIHIYLIQELNSKFFTNLFSRTLNQAFQQYIKRLTYCNSIIKYCFQHFNNEIIIINFNKYTYICI